MLGPTQGITNVVTRPDGSGYVQWGNGAVATFRAGEKGTVIGNVMTSLVKQGTMSKEEAEQWLRSKGYGFSSSEDGGFKVLEPNQNTPTPGLGAGQPPPAPMSPSGLPTGGGLTASPTGGGGAYGGGGGGGGGGASIPAAPSPWGGGGGGGGGGSALGGFPTAPTGAAPFDWNAPLGFTNPGPGPGPVPGQGYQSGSFAYGRPRSIFEGLPANPTFGDVVGSTVRRQEENRDAALDIYGNARSEIGNDPLRGALRGRTQQLLANPFSLDEATFSRIQGGVNAGITARAERQAGEARDRAAQMGGLRDGQSLARQDAIRTGAAGQLAATESDLRVKQAIQNQQDLRSAMASALPVISEETQAKTRLDEGAARDVLGGSSFYADAFLSSLLNNRQNPGSQYPQLGRVGMYGGSPGWFGGVGF